MPVGPDGPVGPSPRAICQTVHNDPAVLGRYRVESTVREEWFVDDDGLQEFLRQGERPAGIVRIRGKVLVAKGALDPFPELGLDLE